MGVRRRKGSSSKSSEIQPENSGVRGVQSVNPLGGEENNTVSQPTKGSGPVQWLRSGVSTLGSGLGNALKSGASNLFGLKAVGTFAKDGVNRIASATNLSNKAVTGVLITTMVLTGGTGAMTYVNYRANSLLVKQEDYEDECVEDVNKMVTSVASGPTGNVEDYALKAWSIAKAFGLSDEQAAGMLGNMQEESGMDPTTIEGIYDEPFDITAPQKAACVSNLPESLCDYTRTTLRQKYINSGFKIQAWTTSAGCTMAGYASGTRRINSQAYEGTDGHFFPGIGLFGFTGPEGNALFNYASSTGGTYNWYDFDLQMAFIFDTTGGYSRASWVESWKNQSVSSAAEAAVQWNINFEGNAGNFKGAERAEKATYWYNKFKGTAGDTAYAQSVIALANTIQGGAQSVSYKKAADECADAMVVSADNSDLARAAVSYAYETIDEGLGNDGTELYRYVHDAVYPSDTYYQSCDRGVATAVRWSGYDDNFPAGSTSVQDAYMSSSSNWEFVGEFTGNIDELQPGDILITTSARRGGTNGHIVLYVSNEIVKEKFPNSEAMFVSASINERSPGCEDWSIGKFVGEGYYVYRNVQKSNPSLYTSVADGMTLNDR